jgi:predicted RNA polymerase sigma factor
MEPISLDQLYEDLINAEATEAAAAIMLGVDDDVAVRAEYEIAVERVEDARDAYDAALSLAEESAETA